MIFVSRGVLRVLALEDEREQSARKNEERKRRPRYGQC
jgi:hypothetical protein